MASDALAGWESPQHSQPGHVLRADRLDAEDESESDERNGSLRDDRFDQRSTHYEQVDREVDSRAGTQGPAQSAVRATALPKPLTEEQRSSLTELISVFGEKIVTYAASQEEDHHVEALFMCSKVVRGLVHLQGEQVVFTYPSPKERKRRSEQESQERNLPFGGERGAVPTTPFPLRKMMSACGKLLALAMANRSPAVSPLATRLTRALLPLGEGTLHEEDGVPHWTDGTGLLSAWIRWAEMELGSGRRPRAWETLVDLAASKSCGKGPVVRALTDDRSNLRGKRLSQRIQLLIRWVDMYGVEDAPEDGIQLQTAFRFAALALESPLQNARDQGMSFLQQLCKLQRRTTLDFVSKSLSSEILEQLRASLKGAPRHAPNKQAVLRIQSRRLHAPAASQKTHLRLNGRGLACIAKNIAVHSRVEVVYLYDNSISTIENLDFAKNLRHLYLQCNKITSMKGLKCLINLEKLYLDENRICRLEGLQKCKMLTELHLRNQKTENYFTFEHESLEALDGLEMLNVGSCNIADPSPLGVLRSLRELHLGENCISDMQLLGQVSSGCKSLRVLSLQNNPISDHRKGREHAILLFPQVEVLDTFPITAKERLFLQRLYERKMQVRRGHARAIATASESDGDNGAGRANARAATRAGYTPKELSAIPTYASSPSHQGAAGRYNSTS